MARPGLRFASLLGALFVLLVVIGFLVAGDTPDVKATGSVIRGDYDNEGQHQVGAYLVALGAVALVFFAGHWRAVLRSLNPSDRMANVALAGASVSAAGFLVASVIHSALAEAANKASVGDQALQSLNALDNWSFYPFALGLAIFALASGVALVNGRTFFPAWLAWAAVVIGVLGFVPFAGFFAFILTGIWVLVISLMLFSRWDAVQRLAGNGTGPAEPRATIP